MNRRWSVGCGLLFCAILASSCNLVLVSTTKADTFGIGASSFEIEFVTIGAPGNPVDTTGQPRPAGAVPYEYRIGKYEISEQMIDKANALGALGISKDTRGPDKPATSVSWFEAARFVNWLNTSTGHTPAYKFVPANTRPTTTEFALWEPGDFGYDPNNLFRNKFAKYFLPSVDEWYKAAYYDPATGTYFDYPTGSNIPPLAVASGTAAGTAVYHQDLSSGPADIMLAGGLSPFGTTAQGGNVGEWEETELNLINDDPFAMRAWRGGLWAADFLLLSSSQRPVWSPGNSVNSTGFRVASVVPESGSVVLMTIAIFFVLGLPAIARKT